MPLSFFLADETATARLGAALGRRLDAGDVIALSGPLGAGKTSLARGAITCLTGVNEAPSPTFGLVETYQTPTFTLWHFDLYRLDTADEIWELGFEDALDGGVVLIEWPELIERWLPPQTLLVRLSMAGEGRQATLYGNAEWTKRLADFNPIEGKTII